MSVLLLHKILYGVQDLKIYQLVWFSSVPSLPFMDVPLISYMQTLKLQGQLKLYIHMDNKLHNH